MFAAATGRHFIAVTSGAGNYDVTLEVYPPGPESLGRQVAQTIFLDFDGPRTREHGDLRRPGSAAASPLQAFLGRWGLLRAQENNVINRVVSTVTENLASDFGTGGGSRVRIRNSRDNADPFGQPNVSSA